MERPPRRLAALMLVVLVLFLGLNAAGLAFLLDGQLLLGNALFVVGLLVVVMWGLWARRERFR